MKYGEGERLRRADRWDVESRWGNRMSPVNSGEQCQACKKIWNEKHVDNGTIVV